MTDWSTIASLSTAAGTLVLAVATFSSVRSGQRAARVAEQSLLLGMRPVLAPSRTSDPEQKIMFGDRHHLMVEGGLSSVEGADGVYYFAMGLRNVGAGLAVIQSWHLQPAHELRVGEAQAVQVHPEPEEFRRQGVDLYVPAGDVGYWLGAVRDAEDAFYAAASEGVDQRLALMIDLLYGDSEGGQRTISRFVLNPRQEGTRWTCGVIRHWRLEGIDPRA